MSLTFPLLGGVPAGGAARTVGALLVAVLALVAGWLAPARAGAEVRVVLANDFLASNDLEDDLYTAAFALDFRAGRYLVTAGENMFTDTENGLRFDETHLHVGRFLRAVGRWHPRFEVGLVNVGRGLLGEDLQNAVHRLIGDDEVHVRYVDGDRVFVTVRLAARRPLPFLERYRPTLEVDLASAVGFKDHAQARLAAAVPVLSGVDLELDVGVRYSRTSYDALKPRIADFGPIWTAGVTVHDRVAFSWSYNEFGTRSTHFNFAYLVAWGGARKGGPGGAGGKPR